MSANTGMARGLVRYVNMSWIQRPKWPLCAAKPFTDLTHWLIINYVSSYILSAHMSAFAPIAPRRGSRKSLLRREGTLRFIGNTVFFEFAAAVALLLCNRPWTRILALLDTTRRATPRRWAGFGLDSKHDLNKMLDFSSLRLVLLCFWHTHTHLPYHLYKDLIINASDYPTLPQKGILFWFFRFI